MVVAYVTFPGPESGGRRTPPASGYHPQVVIGVEYASCFIESLDNETDFAFNREHRVSLRLLIPERYPNAFAVGAQVEFFEGSHLVGHGTVLKVQ